jgi:hypothetical protein
MIDCPKFTKMQKMFCGKFVTIAEVQLVSKAQTMIANVNVVDVNVTTKSKTIEEHVFKDRKPRKTNSDVDWEKEERWRSQWWRQFNIFIRNRPIIDYNRRYFLDIGKYMLKTSYNLNLGTIT